MNEKMAKELSSYEGFRKVFSGILGIFSAKSSFKTYSAAEQKGVYRLHKLRHATHEDSQYDIYAFRPEKEIGSDVIKELTERLKDMSLGTIRYESTSYSSLEAWRGEEESLADEAVEITGIAPEYPDIFIFPVIDCPDAQYVIYAKSGAQYYIYPMNEKQVKSLTA